MIAIATFLVFHYVFPPPQPSVLALGVDFDKEMCLEFRMLFDFLQWNIIINSKKLLQDHVFFKHWHSHNLQAHFHTVYHTLSIPSSSQCSFLSMGFSVLCLSAFWIYFFLDQYSSGSFANISDLAKLLLTHLNSFF